MSLAIDSLVTDLMFQSGDALDPEALVEVLGGQEELAKMQVVDPDMQDPRFEMELSPSMPFRRRDERRLMVIDDSVAPMRADPRADALVPIDLRPAKAHLIEVCSKTPVRLGRLFALGGWGDAVLVAPELRDLRAISLLSWALDPSLDIDGRRRASPLGQAEFEEKILAFDKRLDELPDEEILLSLEPFGFEERDGLYIVDVLEDDGTWDTTRSLELEKALAAVDRFSTIVGAKSVSAKAPPANVAGEATPAIEEPAEPAARLPVDALKTSRIGDALLFVFPPSRFDLDVAAQLGKKNWDAVLCPEDKVQGQDRDRLFSDGADFVAQVEFLSEVFLDGKPLSKPDFEGAADKNGGNFQSMKVQLPRFGPVLLIQRGDGSRFITSRFTDTGEVLGAL